MEVSILWSKFDANTFYYLLEQVERERFDFLSKLNFQLFNIFEESYQKKKNVFDENRRDFVLAYMGTIEKEVLRNMNIKCDIVRR